MYSAFSAKKIMPSTPWRATAGGNSHGFGLLAQQCPMFRLDPADVEVSRRLVLLRSSCRPLAMVPSTRGLGMLC